MIRTFFSARAAWLVAAFLWCGPAWATTDRLLVLAYHDITRSGEPVTDPYAVNARALIGQLEWLRAEGYHFVSLQDVLDDRARRRALPSRSVLLTFDDGFESVYTQVFPVLKAFAAPALVAIVGQWLENDPPSERPAGMAVLQWAQLREMVASGLVEVASHSHGAHKGIPSNPQGNTQPALTTHQWHPATHRYETPDAYEARVRADLRRNNSLLQQRLGVAPRAMVWPFGSYSNLVSGMAIEEGLAIGFTLDDGINTPSAPLATLNRVLVDRGTELSHLARRLHAFDVGDSGRARTSRTMHIDLDQIYDPDPAQQEHNLGLLLERVQAMGATRVYLQAFADPDGDGAADALYFPNRHLPMRADLFNRVSWQLRTRTRVEVYAWMPVLAFHPPAGSPLLNDRVLAASRESAPRPMGYMRLSPHAAAARAWIRDIYEDLGRSARFQGLLFHDDATLSDFEDASPHGDAARLASDLPADVLAVRQDPERFKRWTTEKIDGLDTFLLELADTVRRFQPQLRTARNLYARVVMAPESRDWFAQSYTSALQHFDEVVVMAMPYMEQAEHPQAWMDQLFEQVARHPEGLERTVFELQTKNWRTGRPLPTAELSQTVQRLHTLGARHIAYYPDDQFQDQPVLRDFQRVFSMRSAPAP